MIWPSRRRCSGSTKSAIESRQKVSPAHSWVSSVLIFKNMPQARVDCIETGKTHAHLQCDRIAGLSRDCFGAAGHFLGTVPDRLVEKGERGDLKILAGAYHASLELRIGVIQLPFVLFAWFTVSPLEGNWQPIGCRAAPGKCVLKSRLCSPFPAFSFYLHKTRSRSSPNISPICLQHLFNHFGCNSPY